MAGWHHRLDGCESEWTPGVGDGQGGLACRDSWGRKESETTKWLNWLNFSLHFFFFRKFSASALKRLTWFFLSFYSLPSITKEIIYINWIGKYSLLLLRSLALELLPCWIFHWTLPVNSLGPAIFSEGEFWTTDNLSNSYFLTDFGNFLKVFCSFI